jgi:hypothetical protein
LRERVDAKRPGEGATSVKPALYGRALRARAALSPMNRAPRARLRARIRCPEARKRRARLAVAARKRWLQKHIAAKVKDRTAACGRTGRSRLMKGGSRDEAFRIEERFEEQRTPALRRRHGGLRIIQIAPVPPQFDAEIGEIDGSGDLERSKSQ